MNELSRLNILRCLRRDSKASNEELASAAGLADNQAVTYHLQVLLREGLLQRVGARGRKLSPCASLLLDYCDAAEKGLSLFHRELAKRFSHQRYRVAGEVQRVAIAMDADYSARPTAGLMRRSRVSPATREAERKATYCEILKVAKDSYSLAEAARRLGVSQGALAQRIARLMSSAKSEIEAKRC